MLTVNDPDAPDPKLPKAKRRNIIHWVVYNISPSITQFSEGQKEMSRLLRYGLNTRGENVYMGPCPPIGKHRYIFNLYAINKQLNLKSPVTFTQVQKAIHHHVIKKARLVGYYQKNN